ncbi:hypothetical protein AVEN_76061-1 [Araneus ventricosus]|uniref:Uncharacterized protein n=1 Tax=Araneus ventricosus TaxID=182803 RepID=A0A4Y2ESX0_ARAVE|nr:hypothetical protein AVEN_76061-1 [Araneus ventricosus]
MECFDDYSADWEERLLVNESAEGSNSVSEEEFSDMVCNRQQAKLSTQATLGKIDELIRNSDAIANESLSRKLELSIARNIEGYFGTDLVILNLGQMTTPELASPSPNFRTTSANDLMCNRPGPHTRRIFSGIGSRTWSPPAPKLRPYHRRLIIYCLETEYESLRAFAHAPGGVISIKTGEK